jgi:DNA polymerase III psi subunit
MSLDNIQLTPFLTQELFKKSLIQPELPVLSKPAVLSAAFTILGNNHKKIIVVAVNGAIFLPDEQLNFLLGVLSACGLTMDDVAILNVKQNKNTEYKKIEAELQAEKIILFGVTPAQINLPVEFPAYQIQSFNGQTYLTAGVLPDIQKDKNEKIKLWNCLKQIFTAQ